MAQNRLRKITPLRQWETSSPRKTILGSLIARSQPMVVSGPVSVFVAGNPLVADFREKPTGKPKPPVWLPIFKTPTFWGRGSPDAEFGVPGGWFGDAAVRSQLAQNQTVPLEAAPTTGRFLWALPGHTAWLALRSLSLL